MQCHVVPGMDLFLLGSQAAELCVVGISSLLAVGLQMAKDKLHGTPAR